MGLEAILTVVQTISVVVAVLVGCGTLLSRQNGKVVDFAEMKVDIKYIKEAVGKIDPITERLTEVESSAKQAHKRLDEHINNHGKGGG